MRVLIRDARKQVPISATRDKQSVSPSEYSAWLFDLDGVITDTASVHAAAWKRMFDAHLQKVSEREGRPFKPFEIDPDYYQYVDGKPRYDGVNSFLRSRRIVLEWGNPSDPPDRETVCGLGNRKNVMFNEVLKLRGVEVFGSSVALIRELRSRSTRVAVVTLASGTSSMLELTATSLWRRS